MARINNSRRKALFQTPGGLSISEEQPIPINNLAKLDIAEKALATLHSENEFNISQKDSHNERLYKLKMLLIEIEEDNWKYENVSKLIGI